MPRVRLWVKFAAGQFFNQFAVGGKKVQFAEGVRGAPLHRLEDSVLDLAGNDGGAQEDEFDGFAQLGVLVAGAEDFDADFGGDAEFFLEFSGEGDGDRFAGLKFAAGKFPHESEGVAAFALADENLAAGFDEGCYDG